MKTHYTIILCTLLLSACANEDIISNQSINKGENHPSSIILQERDPSLSKIWSKERPRHHISSREYIPLGNYMGRGYTVGNSIIGDNDNLSDPVIDLTKLRAKFSTPTSSIKKLDTKIRKNSYVTFDRYEEKTSLTETVKTGFNLDLKVFSLGKKKTQTTTFKTTNIKEDNRVYGEAEIEIRHAVHTLNIVPVVLKTIGIDCLDDIFLASLYYTPISEILDYYGPLVVTGYYTGGRASALYVASRNMTSSFESTERDMTEYISASFSWGKEGLPKDSLSSASGSLDFGKNTGNSISKDNTVKNMYCAVKTSGGIGNIDFECKSYEELNIDLTSWLRSIENEDNHVLIGLKENKKGLVGLSEFVIEENFKQRIQDTHLGYTYNSDLLTEPFIEIMKVYARNTASGEKLYEIAPVLHTRQQDLIILSDGKSSTATDAELRANNNNETFMQKSRVIAEAKGKFYKCAIKANSNTTVNPYIRIPFNISLPGFDENNMYKFKNESTNIWYIYNSEKKYAYSFYDDSFILEAYGINEWINTIPEKSISTLSLAQNFKIIGL